MNPSLIMVIFQGSTVVVADCIRRESWCSRCNPPQPMYFVYLCAPLELLLDHVPSVVPRACVFSWCVSVGAIPRMAGSSRARVHVMAGAGHTFSSVFTPEDILHRGLVRELGMGRARGRRWWRRWSGWPHCGSVCMMEKEGGRRRHGVFFCVNSAVVETIYTPLR